MNDLVPKPRFSDPRDLPETVVANTYVPEIDYAARGYQTFGTIIQSNDPEKPNTAIGPTEHFCTRCQNYYKGLYVKGVLKKEELKPEQAANGWPISCYGDKSWEAKQYDDVAISNLVLQGVLEDTPEAKAAFLRSWDPVAWAEVELHVTLDWYQAEMVRCSSTYKAARAGRRLGKTYAMCVDILHRVVTKEGRGPGVYEILIVCPYEAQVKRIFEELDRLVKRSSMLQASLKRQSNSPGHEREFHNGAFIRGFSAGSKSGARSDKVRGQGAAVIYFDEIDYMADEDIEVIIASMASEKNTKIWMTSTPTGARSKFWQVCLLKYLRYKEFHFISPESPRWSSSAEDMLRVMYSEGGYRREFFAEFGTPTEGVFRQGDLDKTLRKYTYAEMKRNPEWKYVMGVDWNKLTGTHIVVLERGTMDKKGVFYRVVAKHIIRRSDFTQTDGVSAVIKLAQKWRPDFIYVDQGFGDMQVENLWRQDIENPDLRLQFSRKLKPIYMNQAVEIADPLQPGNMIKKAAKPFMVEMLASWVAAGVIFIPESEDTHTQLVEKELPFLDIGLVQQMREFRIEKVSRDGHVSYSQGYEHTLTALGLAVLGMVMNFTEVNEVHIDGRIVGHSFQLGAPVDPRSAEEADEQDSNKRNEQRQIQQMTMPKRTFDAAPVGLPGFAGSSIDGSGGRGQSGVPSRGLHGSRIQAPTRTIP